MFIMLFTEYFLNCTIGHLVKVEFPLGTNCVDLCLFYCKSDFMFFRAEANFIKHRRN